jgi:hypothetical protein
MVELDLASIMLFFDDLRKGNKVKNEPTFNREKYSLNVPVT